MSKDLEDFLAHNGVLGMKWGHRTAGVRGSYIGKVSKAKEVHEDAAKAHAVKSKKKTSGIDSLSNNDLQTYITRVNLEKQFKTAGTNKQTIEAGQSFATDLVKNTGKDLARDYARQGAKLGVKLGVSAVKTHFKK